LYKPEDIRVLNGTEIIKKRPEMYFGSNGPTPEFISSAILRDAVTLGSKYAVVRYVEGWWLIAAETDWLSAGNLANTDLNRLFSGLVPFPEAGVNGIRSEVFASVYSSALLVGGKAGRLKLKGNDTEEKEFDNVITSIVPNERVLGFKFDNGK
jgi:hypothetical protein